jgi:hypothetical protein
MTTRTAPSWLPRDIVRPVSEAEKAAVRHAQRVLRLPDTGDLDQRTEAALRGLQARFRLAPSGILDAPTGLLLDRLRPPSEEGP